MNLTIFLRTTFPGMADRGVELFLSGGTTDSGSSTYDPSNLGRFSAAGAPASLDTDLVLAV